MCTLGGFLTGELAGKTDYDLILNIVENIDLRGRDSFGTVLWMKDATFKRVVSTSKQEIINVVKTYLPHIKGALFIGRAIPAAERVHGTINIERDTQPFTFKDVTRPLGNIAVIHNGLISNDKKLKEQFALTPQSEVDTAILPELIQKQLAQGKGIKEVIELLEGSYALAVFNSINNTLNLTTNFMPLYYTYQNGVTYWASDPIQLPTGKQVPYYNVLTWDLKSDKVLLSPLKNKLDRKKVLVICSGGLDSATTAHLYKVLGFDVTLLHYKYGQRAGEVEDFITEKIATHIGVPRLVVDVKQLFENTKPSVLLGNKNIDPKLRHLDMESTLSYVGARNLIFTSVGMAIAEKLGAGTVALGLNLDDSAYPDNNITFLRELTKVSACALDWYEHIKISAPFVHLTKKEIIEIGIAIGTPFHLQASCYYPILDHGKVINCGECGCDKLREYSFKALGVIDPVIYKKGTEVDWTGYKPIEEVYPGYKEALKSTDIIPQNLIPYFKFMDI